MSIIDNGKKQPRIIDTSPRQPRIDPVGVARELGAELVEHPKVMIGNTPELYVQVAKQERSVGVSQEEWEQLAALAQELSTPEQTATPSQVGRALLRKALTDLTQGKQQLKASLQDKPSQAAE